MSAFLRRDERTKDRLTNANANLGVIVYFPPQCKVAGVKIPTLVPGCLKATMKLLNYSGVSSSVSVVTTMMI